MKGAALIDILDLRRTILNSKKKMITNSTYRTSKEIPESIDEMNFFGIKCDENQQKVVDSVWKREKKLYMVNSIAGSGKTLISTALGVLMVKYGIFDRVIYITFPGIYEKSQGFLPGDLLEKSEPYFQPLYDALITIGELPDHVCNTSLKAVDNGTDYIECAVSTYMRGINITNAFVIIDEAENADLETLAKVISRVSDSCITMLIGHAGQCDMYDKTKSGFTACIDFNRKYNSDNCESFELVTNHRGWVSQFADLMLTEYEKPCYGFIYMTKNLVTGKLYIGLHRRTMNPEDIDDSWYLGSGTYFMKALAKYGEDNFERTILHECENEESLLYMEKVYIAYYNAVDDEMFYNIAKGGRGGIKFTEEQKEHMRHPHRPMSDIGRSHMSRTFSEATRKKLSENAKKNLTGYVHSDESREHMRSGHIGNRHMYKDGIHKEVKPEMVEEYLQEGWIFRGHMAGKQGGKKTILINNGYTEARVRVKKLDDYLAQGWQIGRFIGTDKINVYRNEHRKNIFIEQLTDFELRGWSIERPKKSQEPKPPIQHHYNDDLILCKICEIDEETGQTIKEYFTVQDIKNEGLDPDCVYEVCRDIAHHHKGRKFKLEVLSEDDRTTPGLRPNKATLIKYGHMKQ